MSRFLQELPYLVYHDEPHVADWMEALYHEMLLLWAAQDDLYLQLRPSTSTWGMKEYEREYAITPTPSPKNKDVRLSNWRVKRRGRGTSTEELIRSIAEEVSGWPMEIVVASSEYIFYLKLADIGGIPDYLPDLMAIIREIRPAHLGIYYRVPVNTPGTVYTAGRNHQLITGVIPLPEVAKPETPVNVVEAFGRNHQLIREQIGGPENVE